MAELVPLYKRESFFNAVCSLLVSRMSMGDFDRRGINAPAAGLFTHLDSVVARVHLGQDRRIKVR